MEDESQDSYFDLVSEPMHSGVVPNLDSTSVDYWLSLLHSESDQAAQQLQRNRLQDSSLLESSDPEMLTQLCAACLQSEDGSYFRSGELLYFLSAAVRRSGVRDYEKAFEERVAAHFTIGMEAVSHRIRVYRYVYQRMHDELPNHEHRMRALDTLTKLSAKMLLRLGTIRNATLWEFQAGNIVLKNCRGAGQIVDETMREPELVRLMKVIEHDPVPEMIRSSSEGVTAPITEVERGTALQRHIRIQNDGGDAKHFLLLNAAIVPTADGEYLVEPADRAMLSAYMSFDEHCAGRLPIERNRKCGIYDARRECWNIQPMEDVEL